ncbi:DUF502 domain-containing protein [Halosimplex rubrum]|uniref:DUF502 domain-containing protein n=1 Tax=Halosimplex rubrum TaxID=869889 RepID=A0A7D5NXX5_9EURY|nr:DUF502 domain-containing protein [Halosimplex rubrum]QLH76026.1 DUF502 domain-containing protein [Halosimplex rubrum]
MSSASWKRDFASGLVILVPLLVTAYIIVWIYTALAGLPLPVQNYNVTVGNGDVPVGSPLRVFLTLLIFVLVVFSLGYLMRTTFGDVIEDGIDRVMNQLPGLRVVYNASKMAVETVVSGADELQEPVKIETWQGMRMTAFKTGQTTEDGRDVLFLPTAPNITTGFVVEVDPDSYEETDERVEEALTRVLSAGFGEAEQTSIPVDVTADSDDDEA